MQLKGINNECKNEAIKDALKKSGYKLLEKKISWPRLKGPAGLRVDVSTGHMVDWVR